MHQVVCEVEREDAEREELLARIVRGLHDARIPVVLRGGLPVARVPRPACDPPRLSHADRCARAERVQEVSDYR